MCCFLFFFALISLAAQEVHEIPLADKLMAQGRYPEADAAYSELLLSRPGEPDLLIKRGSIRMQLGRHTEARTDLEAALSRSLSSINLGTVHAQLGILDQIQGGYTDAIRHHLLALKLKQESYGPQHATVGVTWNRLGEAWLASGSIAKAGDALAEAVAILAASPSYGFQLCLTYVNTGRVFLQQRRYLEAAASFAQAQKSSMEESGCTAMIALWRGELRYAEREFPEAERYFRESLRIGGRVWPDGHATTAGALHGLARIAAARNQFAEARELFHQSLDLYERVLGPTHPDVREVLLDLVVLLRADHRGREVRRIAARIRLDFPVSLHSVSVNALHGR
jgi:tetratricopeptide (TPR) repeat protein